jgi:hypothetical protein
MYRYCSILAGVAACLSLVGQTSEAAARGHAHTNLSKASPHRVRTPSRAPTRVRTTRRTVVRTRPGFRPVRVVRTGRPRAGSTYYRRPGVVIRPAAVAYYVSSDGQVTGPFDRGALAEQAQAGSLTGDTPVWRRGLPDNAWTAAGNVPELADLFEAATPPAAPQPPPGSADPGE